LEFGLDGPDAANPKATINFEFKFPGADLAEADLSGADLRNVHLVQANLMKAKLNNANLAGADLREANLAEADLTGADLSRANLWKANLWRANLSKADLSEANLNKADLTVANLRGADLTAADLSEADLRLADLREACLRGAEFYYANLGEADLSYADLSKCSLLQTSLVRTVVDQANVSGSLVYGISVWDLIGEFEEQKDLIITRATDPEITVDNIKVAQFIYLVLNNQEIRDVINTLTSKTVLILGRFTPERKAILDALKNKLREYNLIPIVFDFERPHDKDFTETIQTLAGLCYFVIADITNPKSSPLELQATIPNYQVPFVPIIQEGEKPFAMMIDLQKKYHWVLDTLSYSSTEKLIKALKPAIIDPAIQKHNELRLSKAREPKIRSAEDFIEDKGLVDRSNSVE
jgi:uncharacterized protein YjbI with pentapeptide repeats